MADPLPFGVGSPAEPTVDQAGTVNALAGAIWNLPKHLIDASANAVPGLRREDYTDNPTAPQPNQPMYNAVGDTVLGLLGGSGWAPAEANSLRMGIKAFHGSPHDFDKFDMSKLGSGEGAQAYGHGLYFAENERTARHYRDALQTDPKLNVFDEGGIPVSMHNHPDPMVRDTAEWLMMNQGDPNATTWKLHSLARMYPDGAKDYLEQAKIIGDWQKRGIDYQPGGRMYEVNLETDPNRLLDWHKPREAQSAEVIKALREINPNEYSTSGTMFPPSMTGKQMYNQMSDIGWHRARGRDFPSTGSAFNPENASTVLNEAGIPGIKYLDALSRYASEKPSHNYVAFNDKIIEILKKYGIAGVPAAGAAAGVAQEQEKQ